VNGTLFLSSWREWYIISFKLTWRNIFSNTSHLKYNDYEFEGNKDADYIINNYSKIEETNTSDLTIIGQPEDEYDCTKRRLGSENDGQIYNETVDNVYNTSEYHKDVDQLSSGYLQGSNIYKL
jgi:hypothetical protein